jgi:hypothetical protein
MDLSASVLGRSVVSYLVERQKVAVLRIGKDLFDRAALSSVACYNFTAAANLSKLLNAELQVKDTRDVYEHVHPDRLAIPKLGAVSLAVLGAAFEAKHLGGDAPLENWFRKHRGGSLITFASLKHRDEQERAKERKEKKARKASRRNTAHAIRVERFTNRKGRETDASSQP